MRNAELIVTVIEKRYQTAMKFNQLRDFVAVAEHGSLRAAARALGLAQPAITRSIQELEHSLGAQLFIREARGVRLTPIGEGFLTRATMILGEVRRAREAVHQQQDGVEGELVVGLSIAGHLGLFSKSLRTFRRRYPSVRLRIIEGFMPTLEKDLRNGQIDIYVGPVPAESEAAELNVEKLFDNERVVVGRKEHPMAGATRLADLAGADWLATSITHDAGDELNQVFSDNALPPPRVVTQCQSALSILTALVESDLLAMLPVQWVESPLLIGLLRQFELDESFAAPPIMMVHRAGIGLTPAGEFLTHLIREAAKTGFEPV
ncbi:LysR substrate-binding domain-containing protein [Mesobacterium pallidum]|uniref:LysR substrate-binding domain-containing protein n=1 Tax=Mesobacterium pallidum TaxID=2872037 RepID=UPI001EE18E3E|nr:LysR substrate-binding domain-containing protein [Mesobacterium pallidum]